VVDGNLAQGHVASAMGLGGGPRKGVSDVLSHKTALNQALMRDPRSSALVLTSGQPTYETASILSSPDMAGLMRQLRQHCDLVIVDAAPVLKAPDMRALAPLSDAVLMVAPDTAQPTVAVHRAANALVDLQAAPVGVVLTR
jgi:Mrp family chromosome partitioning ATPase